jgi:hypothetical protein
MERAKSPIAHAASLLPGIEAFRRVMAWLRAGFGGIEQAGGEDAVARQRRAAQSKSTRRLRIWGRWTGTRTQKRRKGAPVILLQRLGSRRCPRRRSAACALLSACKCEVCQVDALQSGAVAGRQFVRLAQRTVPRYSCAMGPGADVIAVQYACRVTTYAGQQAPE